MLEQPFEPLVPNAYGRRRHRVVHQLPLEIDERWVCVQVQQLRFGPDSGNLPKAFVLRSEAADHVLEVPPAFRQLEPGVAATDD